MGGVRMKVFAKQKMDGFAIVTGGSRGLGANFAWRLASEGYDVVINYTSESSLEKAEALRDDIEKTFGTRAVVLRADTSDYGQCQTLVEQAVEILGDKIAVLINNAGIQTGGEFHQLDPAVYRKIISVNLLGVLYMTRAVVPYMIKHQQGVIINNASAAGYAASFKNEAYGTAKAGMLGLTRALALEMAKYNVRVNALAPTQHWTDMVANFAKREPDNFEKSCSLIPLKRCGEPEELSEAMSFLLNDTYMTGHCIAHSGGKLLLC